MKQGFTLVEILIVVVILGILAAIVVPQFTNASESATISSLESQLQTIRGQLELYKIQESPHAYPDLTDADGWDHLLDPDGDGDTSDGYLQEAPVNAWTGSSDIVAGTGFADGSADDGWVWDNANGEIFASLFDETNRELN
jgi:general secretion pathway protein G